MKGKLTEADLLKNIEAVWNMPGVRALNSVKKMVIVQANENFTVGDEWFEGDSWFRVISADHYDRLMTLRRPDPV